MARQRKCRVCGGWHDLSEPWPYECAAHYAPRPQATSSLPCPKVIGSFDQPVQSMADGKWYSNARDLRRTYKADGNPQGVEYNEVGNEDITTFTPPKKDRQANRAAIERAIADVDAGRAPPVLDRLPT